MDSKSITSIFVILLVISGLSCVTTKKFHLFVDSSNTYQVENRFAGDQQLVSFFDTTAQHFLRAVGQYEDSVRVGIWSFYTKDKTTLTNWGRYRNPNLGIKTCLFGEADTTMNGDSFVKFKFRTETGNIIVTFTVDGPDAQYDHKMFFEGIEGFMRAEQSTIEKADKLRLIDSCHVLYVSKHNLKAADGTGRLVQNCRTTVKTGNTIVITVLSDENALQESAIIFDGIVTNFFFKGDRLFNAFEGRRIEGFGW